jgi:hypothetical protein
MKRKNKGRDFMKNWMIAVLLLIIGFIGGFIYWMSKGVL